MSDEKKDADATWSPPAEEPLRGVKKIELLDVDSGRRDVALERNPIVRFRISSAKMPANSATRGQDILVEAVHADGRVSSVACVDQASFTVEARSSTARLSIRTPRFDVEMEMRASQVDHTFEDSET